MITDRLQLVPATIALCDAEANGQTAVGQALGAVVPASWPPPVFDRDDVARVRGQLADPTAAGWTLHYLLLRAASAGDRPLLVGIAGFVAPPTPEGVVEIGYAVVEEFQRVGLATEAVRALLAMPLMTRACAS